MNRRAFIWGVVIGACMSFGALAGLIVVLSGCGGVVADSPDADADAGETFSDVEVVLPDGVECTESACAEACVVGGYIDGFCVGVTCFCTADTDVHADEVEDVDDAGEDVVEDVGEPAEDAAGEDVEVEDVGPEDVVEAFEEDAAVEDVAEEDAGPEDVVDTDDGGMVTCLEVPEGGHTDFESGTYAPFEPAASCTTGRSVPWLDRSHAHSGSFSLATNSSVSGCEVVHRFYPLGGTRTSLWVLIPGPSLWEPCASYPCTEAELSQGPTTLGARFRRDGGIAIHAGTPFATWVAETWNLVEIDFTCVGTTGYHSVVRVNDIVGLDRMVPDSGVACPPTMNSTVMQTGPARFWVDDYCIEALD